MTRDCLDPLSFTGCIAEFESNVSPGVSLLSWRSQRSASKQSRQQVPSSDEAAGAAADRAPEDRTLRARLGARRPRSGRGSSPEEVPVNSLHLTARLVGRLAARRARRDTLRRLGRQGRVAAYRRGEFDFDTCCQWAAGYPDEVPLLNGEFEFIARTMPEVCEP
jgi:hypothetical protein